MRVLLWTYGSRGDVEPLAALAVAVQKLGAEAVVSAPGEQEFVELLARAGVEYAPAFMPVRQWIDEARQAPMPLPKLAAKMIPLQFDLISAAAARCGAIVATGLLSITAWPRSAVSAMRWRASVRFRCRRTITRLMRAPVIRCRRK
jgi:vancomycin aglycone glucosyltransferase